VHYSAILSGDNMNKRQRGTVILDGSSSVTVALPIIDDSYSLVVNSLP
jgi:predicted DNA-binding protein (MmcQ/YjbR family)